MSTPAASHQIRRRPAVTFRAATLLLAAALPLVSIIFGPSAVAQTAGGGTFLVENYATGTATGGYYKRGYVFEVTRTTVVTGLTGAGTSGGTFAVGLYSATTTAGLSGDLYNGGSATPTALLGSMTFSGTEANGANITKNLASPVTLQPGNLYILAQMLTSGSGSHVTVTDLNRSDILSHPRIARWGPTTGVYRWSAASSATSFVGQASSDINTVLPRLGLEYDSDCTLPTVTTDAVTIDGTAITFTGTLTDTGGTSLCPNPAVALAFEQGTQENVGTTGTFSNATPSSSTSTTSFTYTISDLQPNQTYYFRAVAINEAGRSNGQVRSFTFTPEPQVSQPTLDMRTDSTLEVSANLESLGTSSVTSHGFCVVQSGTDDCTDLGGAVGTGPFEATLSGRQPNTSYQVYAFAENSTGRTESTRASFTTERSPQSIDAFTAPADRDFSPDPFSIEGSAILSSGLAPLYTSISTNVCTVSGSSVTMLRAGTCEIAASHPGDAAFADP